MIHGSCTEFGKELFRAEHFEVFDDKWPQVEDIVAGEGGSLFNHGRPRSLDLGLDGHPQPTGSRADHHDLFKKLLPSYFKSSIALTVLLLPPGHCKHIGFDRPHGTSSYPGLETGL